MSDFKMSRYMAMFSGVFIASMILFSALAFLTPFDVGGSAGFIEMLIAAMAAGQLFVKDFGRAPTQQERRRLIWHSYGISLVISAAAAVVLGLYCILVFGAQDLRQLVSELAGELPAAIWLGIFVFALALSYLPLHLGYGLLTTLLSKRAVRASR